MAEFLGSADQTALFPAPSNLKYGLIVQCLSRSGEKTHECTFS